MSQREEARSCRRRSSSFATACGRCGLGDRLADLVQAEPDAVGLALEKPMQLPERAFRRLRAQFGPAPGQQIQMDFVSQPNA